MRGRWILVTIAVMATSFGGMWAQTPDGQTPAEESVCDTLQGGTPSLYGLCVAFCEAHDCQPDAAAADPFADCKPASRKILTKYRQRMQPGDPDMPCVSAGECPCFAAEQVEALPPRPETGNYAECNRQLLGAPVTNILTFDGAGDLHVAQVTEAGSSSSCIYATPDSLVFHFEITGAEAVACRTIVEETQELTGLCP